MAIHSSIIAGKFHGQRGLAGYSPQGHKESDATEHVYILHITRSLALPVQGRQTGE